MTWWLSHRSNDPVSRGGGGGWEVFFKDCREQSQRVTLLGGGTLWTVSDFDQDSLFRITLSDQRRHRDNELL